MGGGERSGFVHLGNDNVNCCRDFVCAVVFSSGETRDVALHYMIKHLKHFRYALGGALVCLSPRQRHFKSAGQK